MAPSAVNVSESIDQIFQTDFPALTRVKVGINGFGRIGMFTSLRIKSLYDLTNKVKVGLSFAHHS